MTKEQEQQLKPLLLDQVRHNLLLLLEHGKESYLYNFMRTITTMFPGRMFNEDDLVFIEDSMSEAIDKYLNDPDI